MVKEDANGSKGQRKGFGDGKGKVDVRDVDVLGCVPSVSLAVFVIQPRAKLRTPSSWRLPRR